MREILRWENSYFKALEFCRVTDNIKIFDFRYFCPIKISRWRPLTECKHTHIAYEVIAPYMTTVCTSEGTSEIFNVCRICIHEMNYTPRCTGTAITAVKVALNLTNYAIRIQSCINSARNAWLLNYPSFILACISEKESY
jgi:hypothetical protein